MATFELDLFISYAHIDNQPLSAEQEGWISRFHHSLAALLSMRLGKQARIWRDDKLQGNDVFADEIVEQFGRTAVFVSVLTPRYLKSRWCTREITEFCARAESSGGVVVSNKARVFKVLKTPVDSEEPLAPMLQSLLGYEFFTMDEGAPLELDALYGERFAQDYHRKVNRLAFEIAELLRTLEETVAPPIGDDAATTVERTPGSVPGPSGEPGSAPETMSSATRETRPAGAPGTTGLPTPDARADAPSTGRRVYLADCSFDRKEERETLRTELLRLGHEVLPDRRLPQDENDCVAAVTDALERSELAVHLVGAHPGAVTDGPGAHPVVVLQNALASARSAASALPRIVWLPADTRTEDPRQQAFLEALHEDADAQCGADLITGGIESLRQALYAALEALGNGGETDGGTSGTDDADDVLAPSDGVRTIHLLCTKADRKATVPLRRALKARGVEVTLPAFEGAAAEVRETNRQLLTRCDAVILYYGGGDEAWKRTADGELRKLPAYRGGGDVPLVHTYLAAPSTCDKEDLVDMNEPNLVDALDGFDEAQLEALLDGASAVGDVA